MESGSPHHGERELGAHGARARTKGAGHTYNRERDRGRGQGPGAGESESEIFSGRPKECSALENPGANRPKSMISPDADI